MLTRAELHRSTLWLAVAGALLILTACPHEPEADRTRRLRASSVNYIRFTPQYLAIEEGYFAEQGLEVELVRMQSASGALAALARGDLDVVSGYLSAGLFNLIHRGEPIRIVADRGWIDPDSTASDAVAVRPELLQGDRLQSGAGPAGLRFSLRTATTEEFILSRILLSHGIDAGEIEARDLPPAAEAGALRTGSIDAVLISEPWLTRLERDGLASVWLTWDQIAPGLHTTVVVFGPNLLEDDPEAGRRFMVAHLRAIRQFMRGPTELNLAHTAAFTGVEADLLQDIRWPEFRRDGLLQHEPLRLFQEWAVETGYQDGMVSPNIYWEPAFIEHANSVLERMP